MEIFKLLTAGVAKRASDIHIIPKTKPLLRIDGTLVSIKDSSPFTPTETKGLIYGLLTPDQQEIFEEKLALEMALSLEGVGNFRVSVFHQLNGVAAVFRIVPEHIPNLKN